MAEETARLRQDLVSLREEVRILEMNSSRRTNRSDREAVETVTERFDTAGRLLSRTTEHRDNRSTTTVDETSQALSQSVADSIGTVHTELDGERSEQAQSRTESEDIQKDETVPKKGLSWWQKTLMYCGGAALIWVAFRLFKPRLKGVLSAIKTFLSAI